jgi:hypothetical protein
MNEESVDGVGAIGALLDRLLEVGLWLVAGYVLVYSFAGLNG